MTSISERLCIGAATGLALLVLGTLATSREARADKPKIKGTIVVSTGPVISTGDEPGTDNGTPKGKPPGGIAYVPPHSDNPPPQIGLAFDVFGGGDASGEGTAQATLSATAPLRKGQITRWEIVRTSRSLLLYVNGKAVQEVAWPTHLADAPLTIYARSSPFDADRYDYGDDFVITLNVPQGSATNTYQLSAPVVHF